MLRAENVSARWAISEWREGWKVVLAAAAGLAATSAPSFSLGVMLKPMTEEFGWSRAQFSSGWTLVTFTMLVCSPLVGAAIDRFGSRRVALPALSFCCLAFAGLSFAGPALTSWYACMFLLGIGMASAGPLAWMPAIASRFDRSRATAIAIALMGLGISTFVTPIIATELVTRFGFRGAFPGLAVLFFVVSAPLVFLYFYDAKDLSRNAARREKRNPRAADLDATAIRGGMTFQEAIRTTRFWRLALSMLIIAGGTGTLILHIVPMLTDEGISPVAAAATLGLMGPASIAGRLVSGFLLDRFSVPPVTAIAFSLAAVGYFLLAASEGSVLVTSLCIVLVGIAAGAEIDVAAYAASRYFGLKAFGAIYGFLAGMIAFSYGTLPVIAGRIKDVTDSYDLAMGGIGVAVLFAIIFAATLGRYPDFSHTVNQPADDTHPS